MKKVNGNDENGPLGKGKRRTSNEVDHWAFLEDIEAPMWADLTLEPMLKTEDNDDSWFDATHLFHKHSARKLRAAFSHSDEGNDFLNFKLLGLSSPTLPSSVSKSRGKDYRSRNWGSKGRLSLNKNHPLNDLGIQENKPEVSYGSGTQSRRDGSECNSCVTTVSGSSQVTNQLITSTSGASTSSITTESGQQQKPKVLVASEEAFGQTGGLLNALRTNLRKSCATRPALRLEVCDERDSKGRKSSSCKSSLGSDGKGMAPTFVQKPDHRRQVEMNANKESKVRKSSLLKSNEGSSDPVKKMGGGLTENKDRNLNAKAPRKFVQPVTGKVKASNMAKASVCSKPSFKSRIGGQEAAAASTSSEALKTKVLVQKTQTKSTNQPNLKSQVVKKSSLSHVETQPMRSVFNRLADRGKENMRERAVYRQRSDRKNNMPAAQGSDQQMLKLKLENQVGKKTSVGQKVITGRGNDKKLSSDSPVHLR